MRGPVSIAFLVAAGLAAFPPACHAVSQESLRGPEIHVTRAAGPISVDGDLSDPGWSGAVRVEDWVEIRPGDNVPPKVRSVGFLAYDERYFYAGFEFYDPDPSRIRAPYSDRDDISESIDYGGVILDTRNDGRTGILFLATPRGIQYDAVQDDASGNENSAPDFYWDSAGRITQEGWTLEIRIPFSALRYSGDGALTWGIMLFRNYPRDFRYEMFSTHLPRGRSCFICCENVLTGLEGLPSGAHFVVAPYASAKGESILEGPPGTPLVTQPLEATAGLDAKWIPGPDHAVDLAINPDFSQVESDVARISANERFALFYPEKRPLFLEGMDMFSTPVQAVYTRSITSPRWGARATGKLDATAYTVLLSDDRGGGTVILPGPYSSSFAPQDFSSRVALARVRHDLGESFVSFLATDREVQGGGYNRVFGPDFQWRPNAADTVTGQLLLSFSEAPDRPELSPGWNGGTVSGGGADLWWFHSTRSFDVSAEFKSFGDGFRADDGFVPQVGYREGYAETGHTWYPAGFLTRLRAFSFADYQIDNQGGLIRQLVAAGAGMDGRWSSFGRFWLVSDRWRVQEPGSPLDYQEIPQVQLQFILQAAPSLAVSQLYLEGALGQAIDFDNARPGHGGNLTGVAVLRPTDHLALRFDGALRWLNVRPDEGGREKRLFTAQVERLRMTYTFTSRCFVRLIGQYQETTRDPSLYDWPVSDEDGSLSGSFLFSYKLNWQSVLFLGYGADQTILPDGGLAPYDRQFFLKISYAFQR